MRRLNIKRGAAVEDPQKPRKASRTAASRLIAARADANRGGTDLRPGGNRNGDTVRWLPNGARARVHDCTCLLYVVT